MKLFRNKCLLLDAIRIEDVFDRNMDWARDDEFTQMEVARMAYEHRVCMMLDNIELHIGGNLYRDLGGDFVKYFVSSFVKNHVKPEHFRDIYAIAYGQKEENGDCFSAACIYNNVNSPHHNKQITLIFFKDFDDTCIVQATWADEPYFINRIGSFAENGN